MNALYLAGHVWKAQNQPRPHQAYETFVRSEPAANRNARRALLSIAASLAGFGIFIAALQSFA